MSESVNTVTLAQALVNSNQRYRKDCLTMVMASIEEVTKHMRLVTGLKGKETEATIVPQAKFRPYHSEKVVSGTAQLTARTLETFPLEILEEFDPEELYKTIFGQPIDADKINLDIVRRLIVEEMNNACRGLCDNIFNGVRNATGTNAADCFNGFDTIIAAEKTAGNISLAKGNFMTLGTLNEYNIGDKLYLMYKKIDEKLKGDNSKKLKLYLTITEKEMYNNWYANKFGHGNFAGVPDQQYLHGTNGKVELVALPGMDGANHIILTTQNIMKVGVDNSPKSSKYEIRRADNPNVVQFHVVVYMGVDFANIDKEFLFVASRTVKSDDVYLTTDVDEIEFNDTALSSSDTADITLFGFNLTAATAVTVEGTNAAMFSVSSASVSAADANATAGKTLTVTFSPTTAAGEKTATLRIKNETDDVDIRVALKGKATE